jgi:homoserine O-succinyltransferase/O-acetyltransferase
MNICEMKPVKVAILDLYEGQRNEGMRCIRQILKTYATENDIDMQVEEFEVRLLKQVPDLSFDIYISTGGPGSPLESEGSEWEQVYFQWLEEVEHWNLDDSNINKKFVFFICHSFQLVCRHWKLANVCKRKSTAFGVFPIHLLEDGKEEPVFYGMKDPFYAVDSRDWQVIEPRMDILYRGAKILCIEKDRPHVPLERAIMGMRFNQYFIGTQFHPEADAEGMSRYFQTEEKKKTVVENYGLEKWQSMIEHLEDPDKISWTQSHILPNFLTIAVQSMQEQRIAV